MLTFCIQIEHNLSLWEKQEHQKLRKLDNIQDSEEDSARFQKT